MPREGTASTSFTRPFHVVAAVFFQRYPNPYSKHVLSEDVLSRHVDEKTGCLHTLRLLSKTNKKPQWMNMWLPETVAYVVEESIVDPRTQQIMTRTRNVSLASYLSITECSSYKASADGALTLLNTKSFIYSPLTIGRMVEAFSVQRYQSNFRKATQGFQWVLDKTENSPAAPSTAWSARRVDAALGMVLRSSQQAT